MATALSCPECGRANATIEDADHQGDDGILTCDHCGQVENTQKVSNTTPDGDQDDLEMHVQRQIRVVRAQSDGMPQDHIERIGECAAINSEMETSEAMGLAHQIARRILDV